MKLSTKQTAQHRTNLAAHADFLDALGNYEVQGLGKFDMSVYALDDKHINMNPPELLKKNCATAACALGHVVNVPDLKEQVMEMYQKEGNSLAWWQVSQTLFGVSEFYNTKAFLFLFGENNPNSPSAAAQRIRKYLKLTAAK